MKKPGRVLRINAALRFVSVAALITTLAVFVGTAPASASTIPDTPAIVSVTAGNAQVSLTFSDDSNGGDPILLYTATDSTNTYSCTTSGTGCTVAGLTNGTAYTFSVVATNDIGTSPASAPSASVTPLAPPTAPTGLSTSPSASGETLTWTAVTGTTGAPLTGYHIYSNGTLLTSTPTTTYTDTAAVPEAMTNYTLTAYGAGGESAASAVTGYYNYLNITVGQVTTTATLGFTPTSAPLIISPGMAYVATGTKIYLVNMNTGSATLAFGSSTSGCTNSTNPALVTFSGIQSLATDGTYLYAASESSCGDSVVIRKITLSGSGAGTTSTLWGASPYTGTVGLVYATNGYLYATEYGTMYKVNPATGAATTITTNSFGNVVLGVTYQLTSPTQDGSVIYVASDGTAPYQKDFSYNITTGVAAVVALPVSTTATPAWMTAAGPYVYSATSGNTNLSVTGTGGTSVISGTGAPGVQDGAGAASWPSADGAWLNAVNSLAVDGTTLWALDGSLIRKVVQGTTGSPTPATAPTSLDIPLAQVTTTATLPFTPTTPPLIISPGVALLSNGTEIFTVNLATGSATPLVGSSTAGCTNSLNPALVTFSGITALATDGTYLYVASDGTCGPIAVRRVSLVGSSIGATSTLFSGGSYSGTAGIVFATNGYLYATEFTSMYKINPATGAATTLTTNSFGDNALGDSFPLASPTQDGSVIYVAADPGYASYREAFSYNITTNVATVVALPVSSTTTPDWMTAAGPFVYSATSSGTILSISSSGATAPIAGTGASAIVDGTGATASFGAISSLAVDGSGLWVIDGTSVRRIGFPTKTPTEAETYNQFESQDGCQCGDPVDMATGSLTEVYNDLSIPGPGGGLSFTRNYDSLNEADLGPLGYGWADNYQMSLSTSTATASVTITEPTKSTITFYDTSTAGIYNPQPNVKGSLSSTGSGTSIVYTFVARTTHMSYVFNHLGVLTSVVDQDSNATGLTYNGSGQLTTITAPSGRTLTLTYTGALLTKVTDPMGRYWTYAYTSNNLTNATDPRGKVTTYGYSGHLLTTVTDGNGNVTTNTYNASNQVTTQVDGAGLTTTWSYSGNPQTTSTTLMTTSQGSETQFNFSDYQLTSKTDGYASPTPATTTYTYSSTGGVASVINPDGIETAYTYDGSGDLISKSLYPSADPASAETWIYTYNGAGDLLTATSPTGEETVDTYNTDNNLLTSTDPMGNATSYTYSTSGIIGELLTKTNPLGGVTTYGYDSTEDQTSVATTVASGVTNTSRATYNADSRVLCQVSPNEVALGVTCPSSGPYPSGTTSYTYDADGNVLTVTNPRGGVATNVYDNDGNLLTTTDPVGNVTKTTYNGDDLPLTATNGYGSSTPSTVAYAYDLSSTNPACPAVSGVLWCNTTSDGSGKVSATGYNVLGQKVAFSSPSGGTTVHTYSPGGELLTAADADGNVTTNTYTPFGEVASVLYSDPTPTVDYTYDPDGRRTEMVDGVGTTTYTYNSDSNLTSVTQPVVGAGTATIGYTYDVNGDELTITYPGSDVVTYTYNEGGQMTSTEDWNANTTSYAYDANGNLLSTTSPGDLIANTYDANDNLASVTLSSSGSTLGTIGYTRDADGQITNEADTGTFTGGNVSDTYNSLGQLTSYGSTSLAYEPSG